MRCRGGLTGGQEVFRQLTENYELAEETGLPLCQDTGLAVFFVDVGEDLPVEGMNLREAINEGVRKGYTEGFLRKSACDPLTRPTPRTIPRLLFILILCRATS